MRGRGKIRRLTGALAVCLAVSLPVLLTGCVAPPYEAPPLGGYPPGTYHYYYYPDAGVYYQPDYGWFYYNDHGRWMRARQPPPSLHLDVRRRYLMTIPGPEPWRRHEEHRQSYPPQPRAQPRPQPRAQPRPQPRLQPQQHRDSGPPGVPRTGPSPQRPDRRAPPSSYSGSRSDRPAPPAHQERRAPASAPAPRAGASPDRRAAPSDTHRGAPSTRQAPDRGHDRGRSKDRSKDRGKDQGKDKGRDRDDDRGAPGVPK